MTTTPTPSARAVSTRLGSLPVEMRLLIVCPSPVDGRRLQEALAEDRATQVNAAVEVTAEAGLTRLRSEVFDALVIVHAPGALDGLDLTEAVRSMGVEEPVLVLGNEEPGDFAALVHEIGGDAYLHAGTTTTRTLLWTLARALERTNLVRENRRLADLEQHRLRHEQEDARRSLADRRGLLRSASDLPEELKSHYRDLLRSQVIMSTGSLSAEIESLAQMMVGASLPADAALKLHLDALEELLRGLGHRSARHLVSRADLMLIDLLAQISAAVGATPRLCESQLLARPTGRFA